MYSSGINELTIEADFSCHIYHPPRFETDLMHKKRSEWWFTVKMVPTILLDVLPAAFEAIHIAGTTTSPDVKVGLLFQINNTPYRVLQLLEDNMYCVCEIPGSDNEECQMKITKVQSILDLAKNKHHHT